MIRMVQRRLIIPRGDTGSFSIPLLAAVAANDVAVFSIYDPLTRKTIFEKQIKFTDNLGQEDELTIQFDHEDTVNLKAGRYYWDIKLYFSPIYDEDNILVDGAEINSYYAAFSLPICDIKEVAEDVPRQA